MKILKVLICFWVIKCSNCHIKIETEYGGNVNLAEAVARIFDGNDKVGVTVNLIRSRNATNLMKEFTQKLLKSAFSRHNFGFLLEFSEKLTKKRPRKSSVILLENFECLLKLELSPEFFKFNGYFVIILVDGEIPQIERIFELLWNKQIFNVIVMHEEGNERISVKTFLPFKLGKWSDTSPVLINEFKNGKFIEEENIFPDKMRNLQKCPIRVSASRNNPVVVIDTHPNGSHKLSGRDINLITTIAENLNFYIDYSYANETGFLLDNGTASGSLKALLDGKADFVISNLFIKENRLKFFDRSESYFSESMVFLTPPRKSLTSMEKLIHPFSVHVWIMMLSCFVVGFAVIFLVKRRSKNDQNFVFGYGTQTPYLNMIALILGNGALKVPTRNFARFLLMLYLLYSLVIRATYQGSYYDLLKSNVYQKKEIQSFQEMIQNNFTFYIFHGNLDLAVQTEAIQNR